MYIIIVVVVLAAIGLGIWQFLKYRQKREVEKAESDKTKQEMLAQIMKGRAGQTGPSELTTGPSRQTGRTGWQGFFRKRS